MHSRPVAMHRFCCIVPLYLFRMLVLRTKRHGPLVEKIIKVVRDFEEAESGPVPVDFMCAGLAWDETSKKIKIPLFTLQKEKKQRGRTL